MKTKVIILGFLITFRSLFISCDADVTIGEEDESTEISSSNLSGFLDSEVFMPTTTHFEQSELFGDEGYVIKLFADVETCDEFQSIGDISFFYSIRYRIGRG